MISLEGSYEIINKLWRTLNEQDHFWKTKKKRKERERENVI